MKNLFLFIAGMLMPMAIARAEDGFSVKTLTVPQGGSAKLEIFFESETAIYKTFQFDIQMPDGISFVEDPDGGVTCERGELIATTDHTITPRHLTTIGVERFVGASMNNRAIPSGKGVLLAVTYKADVKTEQGIYTAHIKDIISSDLDNNQHDFSDIEFTVIVGEPADTRVVLDELSTIMPEAADGVDVRVKRTFKTGTWSTFCLPFAMTGEQTAEAFGSDVQIADFAGYELTEDDDANITGITVLFDALDATQGIEANHPYIIKTSTDINEFTLDGVDITPEDEPVVATVKRTRKQWSELIGTYVAETVVPEKTLFLNANKFWYSVGSTKMKGYRAYFDFYDVLTEVDEAYSNVRFVIGDASGIHEIDGSGLFVEGIEGYYTIDGRKLNGKPTEKGVYIANGKKILKR